MARPGVTYSEVAAAAAQLTGQGRNPTVEQVRILLKTGSSTTIANHLRQWKSNQDATDLISTRENLPPEFVAMMKGLWDRVLSHSQEQVTAIETHLQQTILELQQEVEKYKSNNQRWQKLYDQWITEKNQFETDKHTLEQALEFAHKETVSLHAKQDAFLQQLQDKQDRVDELHRLHKQTQNNLEHYRESAREQRLTDQQQHEQQRQQLQSEIKTLTEQLMTHREKMTFINQQYQLLQQAHSTVEKNYADEQSTNVILRAQHEEIEKTKNEHLQSSQHWHDQFKETQKKLDNKISEFIITQTEINVLTQQLAETKQLLCTSQDQNKFLISEKWELSQEKAQLEGQMKQMQKMINA